MTRSKPEIVRTEDLEEMKRLGEKAGWEPEDGPLNGVVVAYGCFDQGRMIGCAALQVIKGEHFLEYVAVESSMRGRGLGAALVARIEDEARALGLKELWAKARLPGFYERLGYTVYRTGARGAKSVKDCEKCPQYHTTCFPALVVKRL